MVIYVVQPGDTLESIAREYGVPVSRIISQNELGSNTNLAVGQTLVIQYPEQIYTVQSGDTLEKIADSYGISLNTLYRNNPQLNGVDNIFEGQTLIISYDFDKKGSMEVNGYIYPFVDKNVLLKTLPYLTYLTIFTYGFTPEGNLVDTKITEFGLPEDELISLARQYNVAPIMHLSTLTQEGTFSSELANSLLRNEAAQDVLINNVIARMQEKNYYGFDIDFEYINPDDKQKYVDFIEKLQNALSQNGYMLITALAPKTSADMPGLIYESHDYRGIGEASDYVLLMTYEWGYMFGPPMATAPLNKVREVVEYGVSEIEPTKIFLGVPNYAYDWPLPYIKGETKAMALSNVQATNLAIETGSTILFDEIAQAPYFYYTKDGEEHVVWFDDARSIEAKLSLVPEYGLNGASYWNVMKYFPQNWLVLNAQYDIVNVI